MIKLSASLSKKLPLPGVEFSSQQFGASMEVEVSDTDRPEAIQQRMRELYTLLSHTIDEQIAGPQPKPLPAPVPAPMPSPLVRQESNFQPQSNGNGNGQYARRSVPVNGNGNGLVTNNGNGNGHVANNGNGNGHGGSATQAQQKAIYAICKSIGVDIQDMLADYRVGAAKDLSIRDASTLIDQLKARQNGNGSHAG